jgi:diaminohydroxyphosphoribosylaminopyrimidine deaminase / 5-amino-6-(5-phosphoribosylamino)uracil reductase
MSEHDTFMQRALELARRAEGYTNPNPMVGAVVVRAGEVIAEGYHQRAGEPHAEVNALRAAGEAARGATLYVTLEPCNHHGRTPPCSEAIIEAVVAHVVYAAADPNPKAQGGAQRLHKAGVKVTAHVCAEQAHDLNRFFFWHVRHKRPYVIAKYAMSIDGKIATHTKHSKWITGAVARQRVHQLRHAVDAIIVGSSTALADNPQLTVRHQQHEPRHPLRVVLDSRGRVPLTSQLFAADLPGTTLVATTDAMLAAHRDQLRQRGVDVLCLPAESRTEHQTAQGRVDSRVDGRVDMAALLDALGQRQVQSVLVEGGSTVLGTLFDMQLVNEVWAFVAPLLIGGVNAPSPVAGTGIPTMAEALHVSEVVTEHLENDLLIRGKVMSVVGGR